MTTNAIEVKNLRKIYKKKNVEVFHDVSLSVERGTIFALLGANGAGKTTLVNILTTLLKASGGTAMVDGFDVAKYPEKIRSRISLTGQFAAVDDILTGRENLMLIADLRHVKNPKEVTGNLLEQFDLMEAADRRSGTYSGGMRRRLDIAMSLIGDPSIIFFDEPTTGLDPESRNAMWATIQSLAKSGKTVFLTTQYLEEADQLADKIAILNQGSIVAEGTAQDLKKLLPQGQIEFKFHDKKMLDAAAKLFATSGVSSEEKLSLTITTDGSAAQVARIFARLETAGIDVAEFSQKQPTLDDVFLKIVSESKETK